MYLGLSGRLIEMGAGVTKLTPALAESNATEIWRAASPADLGRSADAYASNRVMTPATEG